MYILGAQTCHFYVFSCRSRASRSSKEHGIFAIREPKNEIVFFKLFYLAALQILALKITLIAVITFQI